ncbi:hypothetical protein P0D88_01875 [Paraburkholderia sp. RL18-103-BIB-C]|uniref:hypothetical protein n=1 Tax=Paraburkholderia sp. RL18-103-BIB-C TaxID=3031637 RepID=UPI0038B7EF12
MNDFRAVPCFLAAVLAALAIAMHAPGQFSYDSVMQIYEASVGRSVGWQPPFMSALLAWLGGGAIGSSIFVALNSCLTYGAFLMVLKSSPMSATRALFCALLIINPVIFAYVGIIWKDVLFGAWAATTFALCIAAERANSTRVRLALLSLTVAILGMGALIRQQGVFMAPLLLIAPLGLVWTTRKGSQQIPFVLGGAVLFVLAWTVASALANRTIVGSNGRSMTAGPAIVQIFDIAGIIARVSPQDAMQTFQGLTVEDDKKVREVYTPDRGDFLDGGTLQQHLMNGGGGASLTSIWFKGVKTHPMAYVQHRISSFASLLDLHDINRCLPIHVGVAGPEEYLRTLNMRQEVSERASFLYAKAKPIFAYPIWQNWFYVLMTLVITVVALVNKRVIVPNRYVIGVYLAGMWVFIFSFVPTGIACDFRYLYPIIPPLTAIGLLLIVRSKITS